MSGLQLLSGYSSNEESDNEEEPVAPKRKKLPLPSEFKVEVNQVQVNDDAAVHGGRQRSYPHERGNWSSLIFIEYEKSKHFEVFCDQVIEVCLPEVKLNKIDDPHISLSRTFILYYHWINEFHTSLKEKLSVVPSYEIGFGSFGIYCNEERTRTFVALTVETGKKELSSSIEIIDKCLADYKLKPYYDDASFHMSIAWCLGDKKKFLEEKKSEFIKILEVFKDSSDFWLSIDHYLFKTGFKEFKLELK